MSVKRVQIQDVGEIVVHKRRGARSMRLSIAHDGTIRLTMPTWLPYKLAIAFAEEKRAWIFAQARTPNLLLVGDAVGKKHSIKLVVDPTVTIPKVRVSDYHIIIKMSPEMEVTDSAVQKRLQKAAERALRQEAEDYLPGRLARLADVHQFEYKSVQIKRLRARWGSCTLHKDIVLNSFLMQLPYELIDYVILHELTHTRVMAHGRPFWNELGKYVEDLTTVKKTMRTYQPILKTTQF